MRAKSIVLLLLALGCGLVASISITKVMANRNTGAVTVAAETDSIFVAMTDIPMGDPLTALEVKLEQWPKDKVPAGALTKIEDVEGRRPKTKIYAGSPILDNLLLSKGASEQGATGLIPKGYRVVSVKVDAVSSGSSLIRPGDRVDVLVHLEKCVAKNIPDTSTRTFLQDIKVFAVNDVFVLDDGDGSNEAIKAQTVSLLVTPEQAEKTMLATELGKIRLVMRSPDDDEQTSIAGTSAGKLFGVADGADRDGESLLALGESKPAASGDAASFLELLNAQKSQPAAGPQSAVPVAADTWAVRILAGSEINDTLLEAAGGEAATDSRPSPSKWKVSGASGACVLPGGSCPAPGSATTPSTITPPPSSDPQAGSAEDAGQEPATADAPSNNDA
ncbi:MAG: Flp pilus assembly protein CpaB [Rhodopirellula sp.]|nr:Flp pilus assembly protein CpaB [Rhodopirellula sp.]